MNRLLDSFARLVTQRRAIALGFIALLTAGTAAWIPTLRVDPTPTQLTASSIEDHERISAAFRSRFGDPDHIVVLLIRARDVLDPAPLAYVHRLSQDLRGRPNVARVDSITTTPLSLEAPPSEDAAGTLEDLDELDAEPEPAVDPEIERALGALVSAAPERFPMGLGTMADRFAEVRFAPAVEGDSVEPEEREQLERALAHAPLLQGRLLSRDRDTTAVVLYLDEAVRAHAALASTVEDVDTYLAAHPAPSGVEVAVGGLPHLFHAIVVKMEADNLRIVPMTLLVCLVLLFVSLRWAPGVVLPLVTVGLSALVTMGGMALFGQELNVITNIVPPLLIIVGISDSIHLIGRYREELEVHTSKLDAARDTLKAMAVACFLTSLTTAVGLGSLVVARTGMLQRFGVIAGIGVMLAYVITVVFLPASITLFKPPLPPKRPEGRATHLADRGWLEKLMVVMTRHILRRPWLYLAGALVFAGLSIWGALSVRVDNMLLDEFDESDPIFTATRLMERELDGVRPLEIMLTAREPGRFEDPAVIAAIDETQRRLRSRDGVLSTLSPADYLHESWARIAGEESLRTEPLRHRDQIAALTLLFRRAGHDPLATFLSTDGRVGRVQVRLGDIGARATSRLVHELRAELSERFGPLGIEVAMTGEAYSGSLGLEAVIGDLLGSLGTAMVVIFALMVLLFASLRLGLLSVPPNVLPLAGTMAWMTLRDIPMNAATVIVFSISLGLAVDGSIHILARYREELGKGAGRNLAIVRSARGTGRAIVVSNATLMLGFGVMLLSSFLPVRRFGELIAITVLTSSLATLIVQPALLRLGAPRPKREPTAPPPRASDRE
ncbi:MAG: MMPL family transporter [Sandaracinaceae bacterium]|nr:MMPL family transporter [Sandaracinaceae bacterium]